MKDQLLRNIPEVSYLDTENTWRYRAILRFFFEQHERLRHFLFPEEILAHLRNHDPFADYGQEMLQADLGFLVDKGNLLPRQDTSRVATIHDFRNKRYRYQAAPYTIEIERMVRRLEQLGESFGGSLEMTLFDRLLERLKELVRREDREGGKHYPVLALPPEQLNQLWEDMYGYFRKMGESASDYLAHLKSEKVEAHMQTEAFLVYKDAFATYLRNFVVQLQRSAYQIEDILRHTDPRFIDDLAAHLARYRAAIPRLDSEAPDEAQLAAGFRERWQSLKEWFHGIDGSRSEWLSLQQETTDTIRRITRFAQRIGERLLHAHSRKKDYLHLAKWFSRFEDVAEAHRLSAVVFGVARPRHLAVGPDSGDDPEATIWENRPAVVEIKPSIRYYRERTRPNPVISREAEKEAMLQQYLARVEAERLLLERLLCDGRVDLAEMEEIEPPVRKALLGWIAKCTVSKERLTRTETGHRLTLEQRDDRRTVPLRSRDGTMNMPGYVFRVVE